jgi:phage terminase small subunit
MKDSKSNIIEIKDQSRALKAPTWFGDPDSFNKEDFVKEMEDSHRRLYKNTCDIDKHLLGMMAIAMESYIVCNRSIKEQGFVINYNDGKTPGINPNFNVMYKSMDSVMMIMKEFGLTPKDRLKNGVDKFPGIVIHFGQSPFENWNKILDYFDKLK